jgi:hypothetical protein
VKRQSPPLKSPPLNRREDDLSGEILFHVKHGHLLRDVSRETAINLNGRLNHKTSFVAEPANDLPSLANTEIPEDHVEDILDIDPPEQPAQRSGRASQILGRELRSAADHIDASLQ